MTEERLLATFGRVRQLLHGSDIALTAEEFLSVAALAKLVLPGEAVHNAIAAAGGKANTGAGSRAIELAWTEMGGGSGEGTYLYNELNRQLAEKIIELFAFAPELVSGTGPEPCELTRLTFSEDGLPGSCALRDDEVAADGHYHCSKAEVFPAAENGCLLVPTPLP